MPHDDRAQHLDLVIGIVILLENGEAFTGRDVDDAARRLDVAREQFEEGGLTRAVCTDDAVTVAGGKFQVDILVEDALAELQAQIVDRNHAFRSPSLVAQDCAEHRQDALTVRVAGNCPASVEILPVSKCIRAVDRADEIVSWVDDGLHGPACRRVCE